jgi:uncharacterized protein (DUF952 family)
MGMTRGGVRPLRSRTMIYHLVEKSEREARRNHQHIATPGPEGFVHCCDERQLAAVKAFYFANDATVVALMVDPTQVEFETRYEPGAGGESERFPHVYGPYRGVRRQHRTRDLRGLDGTDHGARRMWRLGCSARCVSSDGGVASRAITDDRHGRAAARRTSSSMGIAQERDDRGA